VEQALSRSFKLGGRSLSRQLVEVFLIDIEARLVGGRSFSSLAEARRAHLAALFRAEYECT
jgi:hypothetical protein